MRVLHYCTFQQTKAHRNELTFLRLQSQKTTRSQDSQEAGIQSLELLTQDTFHYDLCMKFNQQTAKPYSVQE